MSACRPAAWKVWVYAAFLLPLAASSLRTAELPGGRIALVVTETAGIRRFGYPVNVVMTVPDSVRDAASFRLLDGDKPVAAQFRFLGGDAKAGRRLALDFNCNHSPLEKREYAVVTGTGEKTRPGNQDVRTVKRSDDEIRVAHSKGLQFVVPRNLQGFLRHVTTPQTDYLRGGSAGLVIVGTNGDRNPVVARPAATQVTRSGPLASALRFEAETPVGKGRGVRSVVDLDFVASKSWVQVSWEADDPAGAVAALGAVLNLNIQGEPTLVDFGAGTFVYVPINKGQSAHFRNVSSENKVFGHWETQVGSAGALRPYVVAPKSHAAPAEGWAHVMDRERCTAVAVADFAKADAAEIVVDADGRLRIWKYFGKAGPKADGGKKRLTCWLHFVTMPVHVGAATSPQAMLAPLKVEVKGP